MGYHVAIVRTGAQGKAINQDELVTVIGGQFGFEIERDNSGVITQAFREISGEEVLFFFDGTELWTKNPTETVLKIMIEIANALGNGARVRGDEGETYESITKTFIHSDDARIVEATPKIYWKDLLSWGLPVFAGLVFIYGIGRLLLKYLSH